MFKTTVKQEVETQNKRSPTKITDAATLSRAAQSHTTFNYRLKYISIICD